MRATIQAFLTYDLHTVGQRGCIRKIIQMNHPRALQTMREWYPSMVLNRSAVIGAESTRNRCWTTWPSHPHPRKGVRVRIACY